MDRRVFLLAAFALSGCVAMGSQAAAPSPADPLPELEPLYGANAGRDGITIRVSSNGCTVKTDFAFYVERKGSDVTLSFARKRLDACKSFVQGKTDLSFSWAELGLPPQTPVFLLNPLTAWTGPGA